MIERELMALAPFVELPGERNLAPAIRCRLGRRPQRRETDYSLPQEKMRTLR